MSIIIKTEFNSAVLDLNKDIFVNSYIENGTSIIEFDSRNRKYKKIFNSSTKIKWDKEYTVDVKELSTFQNPIAYRFIIARGSYLNSEGNRTYFTPELEGVSISQHVSKSLLRLSCYLAVNCGISLRSIAMIFTYLFLVPITKSSIQRWINIIGENLPDEDEILRQLVAIKKPEECHIDGYYPMGTDNCVMVVKDENDRILMTHEASSENKDEAIKFLEKIKRQGVNIKFAFCDYSKSFIEAIKAVYPDAKIQADHFHTVKNLWGHLKKSFLKFRRGVKKESSNTENEFEKIMFEEFAKKLWELRWIFLKKPDNLTEDEKIEIKKLESYDDTKFLNIFRTIISSLLDLFNNSKSELEAKKKLEDLRIIIQTTKNNQLLKIPKFLDDHWTEAMQYLISDNSSAKRASNSESGMRFLRRLEKSHDGIRTEKSRKNYIKIYQVFSYLKTKDIADFIENPVKSG